MQIMLLTWYIYAFYDTNLYPTLYIKRVNIPARIQWKSQRQKELGEK